MSLPIDEYIETLKRLAPNIPPATLIAIENDLETKQAELAADRAGGAPKVKNRLVSIILDPEHKLDGLGDFTSLVIQIPEGQPEGETLDRLFKAVYNQRAAAKRKVKVITSVGDAASALKRRFTKEMGVHVRTKEPIMTIVSDNTIPAA